MKLLFAAGLLFVSAAFAADNNPDSASQATAVQTTDALPQRSCSAASAFEQYRWGDDDLFSVETCLTGYDSAVKYLEFQNNDEQLCFLPHFTQDEHLATKIKFNVIERGWRMIFEYDEQRYCGMAGRDKLLMVDTTAVWAMPPGVVSVYFKCLEYNQRAQHNPEQYLARAQKSCTDFREKYLQKLVYLKTY
jgi:hypothetical protein